MMEDSVKQCLSSYFNPDSTKRDIMAARKVYQGLGCITDKFTFSNGMAKQLVKLKGTIPVPFKGKTYNIPVVIWLMDTHPTHAPVCYVDPTPDMCLKPSKNMDHSGRIYLPYLHNWSQNTSNLLDLVKVLIAIFSELPPVYTKTIRTENTVQQSTPYPQQAYASAAPSSTSTPPYPSYPIGSAGVYSSRPVSQMPMPNNFEFYPRYPPPATSASTPYPSYPPTSTVNTPYPIQPTNVPYPATTSNPTSTVSSPNNTGTITDEHIRASLMSAIEDKIRRKINEQTALCQAEMEILLQSQRELNQGKNKLDEMFDNLEKEKQSINEKIQILKNKEIELEKTIEKLSSEEDIDIDEAVITTTPLYKQILNAHCEEAATEDTIYYIGEALRTGVIDLDVFMKQLRALSRKRLILKSLLEKCRMKAGLTV